MVIWELYSHLMGNNIVLFVGAVTSLLAMNWWGHLEEKWKNENKYGTSKKILKIIGIVLIIFFGLPGIILFFGTRSEY